MLNAIILEHEENSRTLLSGLLNEYCPEINLLAAVDSIKAGLDAINTFHPDLVFMEIVLRGETSFELLDNLLEIDFDLIFTTTYNEVSYLLKAIKLSAVDYLLKPINVEELKNAVAEAKRRRSLMLSNKNLQALINNIKKSYKDHQIAIPTMDGYQLVKISNIIFLQSEGAYTYIFLKGAEKILTSKNIKEYEVLLIDHNFFRIHKSYVVNISEITYYIKGNGGFVIMSNKVTLDVSRRRKEDFLKTINRP